MTPLSMRFLSLFYLVAASTVDELDISAIQAKLDGKLTLSEDDKAVLANVRAKTDRSESEERVLVDFYCRYVAEMSDRGLSNFALTSSDARLTAWFLNADRDDHSELKQRLQAAVNQFNAASDWRSVNLYARAAQAARVKWVAALVRDFCSRDEL